MGSTRGPECISFANFPKLAEPSEPFDSAFGAVEKLAWLCCRPAGVCGRWPADDGVVLQGVGRFSAAS